MSSRKSRLALWLGLGLLPALAVSSYVAAQQRFTLTPAQRQALSNVEQVHTLTRSQLDKLRTTQPSGTELRVVGQGNVTSMPQGDLPLTLAPGQYVRSAGSSKSEVIDGPKRYTLPVRFTGFDRTGKA